jgi:hypothetical protein
MSTKGTADTSLVKQPNEQIEYTLEQLQEFKRCCDPDTGPLYFMRNFMWIQHPTKGRLLFEPYDYQLELIENYNNCRKSINMMGRQMGKCLTEKINITVRNKKGEIYDIPIGIFYEYEAAKKNGTEKPDISSYKRSE